MNIPEYCLSLKFAVMCTDKEEFHRPVVPAVLSAEQRNLLTMEGNSFGKDEKAHSIWTPHGDFELEAGFVHTVNGTS
jgi:hypothetical protein